MKSIPTPQQEVSHKKKKRRRGEPIYYEEKKRRISLWLTPSAIEILGKKAVTQECSRSEAVERWLRDATRSQDDEGDSN